MVARSKPEREISIWYISIAYKTSAWRIEVPSYNREYDTSSWVKTYLVVTVYNLSLL